MRLIDQIAEICKRLAPFGWASLFKRHGLDILAKDFRTELHRNISKTIDRRVPGFIDYTNTGFSAIQPYNPAMSLLYHALASPNVHPGPGNDEITDLKAYPTIEELDIIENYIFSTDHPAENMVIRDLNYFDHYLKKENLVIAVFAYQYRPGTKSVHGQYADISYSRTGVARMGTRDMHYSAPNRSFWPVPAKEPNQFCVMPSRYGLFIAEFRERMVEGEVMLSPKTAREKYVFPIHKLFPGKDCIEGLEIPGFDYHEQHISDKLKLLFTQQQINTKFKLSDPPFIRTSDNHSLKLKLQNEGCSVLLVPASTTALVEEAKQNNKTVSFLLKPGAEPRQRYATSLQIENTKGPFKDEARIAPEYANIRFEIDSRGRVQNISDQFPAAKERGFLNKINKGGYNAVVFIDHSCDGCIEAAFRVSFHWIKTILPAYSLVTAPDFFPLCDQSDIANWENDNGIKDQFRQGGSDPLFTTRSFVNPSIVSRVTKKSAFDQLNASGILTTTAIVSMSVMSSGNPDSKNNDRQVSWLPDAASGYFAPGWDVTLLTTKEFEYDYLSTSALGSPFPEDSKLCAALNSFWPAVAPDAARTFMTARVAPEGLFNTAMPLTDKELGYHPLHPKVVAGFAKVSTGWDGEQGPFFMKNRGLVNYGSMDRSDYTDNMIKQQFTSEYLSQVDSSEWISRMILMRNCIYVLPPPGDHVSKTRLVLVSFEKVEKWEDTPDSDLPPRTMFGSGFILEFAKMKGKENLTGDPKRRTKAVEKVFICKLSERYLLWKSPDGKKYKKVNRGTIPLKW